jgi:hypothetical protein
MTIDCGSDVTYTDSGVYRVNANTTCGGSMTFRGSDQILDCQGNTVGTSASGINLLHFQGSGPYIVRNCPLVTPNFSGGFVSRSILVTGFGNQPETVDILIQDTSAKGGKQNGQIGAAFIPNPGKIVCASITQSVFTDLNDGVLVSGPTFLDLSDVSSLSNKNGLFAFLGPQLDVKESVFCSSSGFDVILISGVTGTFSNTTCSSTDPPSIMNETCAMSCPPSG